MKIIDNRWALIVDITLFESLWHGVGDWPPSPFRAYQALVASAFGGRWCSEDASDVNASAFRWLEGLQPPIILAPAKRDALTVQYFVPNNDLDAVGNDPRRTSEIRAGKAVRTAILDGEPRFSYAWFFDDGEAEATRIAELCNRLYRFGRGVDSAYAAGSVVPASTVHERMIAYKGTIARPSSGTDGAPGKTILPCPASGSLESLGKRFTATTGRLSASGRSKGTQFRQPPKALSHLVSYDRPPRRLLLELRELGTREAFYPIRIGHAITITKAVRDLAFERLSNAAAIAESSVLERVILGRQATDADKPRRVRFIPFPSIGMSVTDPSIRRVLVEMPADCPITEGDMRWALVGQHVPQNERVDRESGEVRGLRLAEATNEEMLWHYGLRGAAAIRWQTVTPAVLPVQRPSGKMSGAVRAQFEHRLTLAVVTALRHSGTRPRASVVAVQREPFFARGARSDVFEPDRFNASQLFHVDIQFEQVVSGPLTIGDGRWLGLGLMRPVRGFRYSHEAADTQNDAQEVDVAQNPETGDEA